MKLIKAALALAALAPLAMAQTLTSTSLGPAEELLAPLPSLSITSVTPTFAMSPELITIRGTGLHKTVHVTIGDEPAEILEKRADGLLVRIRMGTPGYNEVTVYTENESAVGQTALYPTIRVGLADALWGQLFGPDTPHSQPFQIEPGVFSLRLANGTSGQYFIGMCLNTRPDPATYFGIGYEFYLASTYQIIDWGSIPETGLVRSQMRWPAALAGHTLHFQGFATQVLPGGDEMCFTSYCSMNM